MYAVPNVKSNIHHAFKLPPGASFVLEQSSRLYVFDIGGLTAFSGLPILKLPLLK